jgi:TRAP-type mannitol/chloroaromatic compound transport system permease large subunit
MILMLLLVFIILLLLGLPLAFSVGIVGLAYFLQSEFLPAAVAVQRVSSASQSFPLLAVPFFVLAGHMMNRTGITDRLVNFSKLLVGWISGGLAHVTIVLSTLMGGVSGSAVADASMQARVLGPAMIGSGLSKGYSAGAIAVSSLITAVRTVKAIQSGPVSTRRAVRARFLLKPGDKHGELYGSPNRCQARF